MQHIKYTGVFVRIALLSALLIGGLIGLTSLIAPYTGYPIDHAHRVQHIHLQTWYFIGGFVLGAGFRIIPQLTARPLPDLPVPQVASVLYVGSALIWVFALPFVLPDPGQGGLFLVSIALFIEMVVWGGFVVVLMNSLWFARKEGVWKGVAAAGLLVMFGCVLSNVVGWAGFSDVLDVIGMTWVRRGYMGFLFVGVPLLAMGICGRALRKKEDPDWAYMTGAALISLGTVAFAGIVRLPFLTTAGAILFLPGFIVFAYGIAFHRQFDRLNIPGFSHGVVVAFSFVMTVAVFYTLDQFTGVPLQTRGMIHVWALGFLTVLIVGFGTWIFPSAAGRVPINSYSTVMAVYVLGTGTLLRVLAPLINAAFGGAGLYTILLLGGGVLQYTGIAIFAVALWPNLPRLVAKES